MPGALKQANEAQRADRLGERHGIRQSRGEQNPEDGPKPLKLCHQGVSFMVWKQTLHKQIGTVEEQ